MSLPTPHIKSISTCRSEWRASSSNRNASSPFSLAIPPRCHRRSAHERIDTLMQQIELPRIDCGRTSTGHLEVPQSPKKALTVTEKPTHPEPYTSDGASTSTILSPYEPISSFMHKYKLPEFVHNDRFLALAVTLGIAVLLAIIVPLAAILPQKHIKPLPISVLMPFYVDPIESSWEQLYDAVMKYHETRFTIIVNPSNGPGTFAWPTATYIAAIKKLNKFSNVQTLGYIDTGYGNIPNTTVRTQIATYAGWKNVTEGLALHGIFFDHTPWENDKDGMAKSYLRNVSATVRHTDGWAGPGEGLVVHNPGRVPNRELLAYRPDLVVLYEGSYEHMPSRKRLHAQVAAVKRHRKDCAMLVRSVPGGLSRGGLRKIIERVRRDVEWLYVTDLEEDVYSGYGSLLGRWLSVAW